MHISRIALVFAVALRVSSVLAQEADLAVEKLGPSAPPAGNTIPFTVTVVNVGPDEAADVTLSDPVPAGMSFVSATQNDGPTFTCDSAVTCTIAALPAGASASFTFTFRIESGTEFTNVATVTSNTPDPNPENDTGTVTVTTGGGGTTADLFVQKSGPAAAGPGQTVTFLITLGNAGPAAAQNVVLTDVLPGGMTFVSFVQTGGPAMTCGTTTCTAATFPAGQTATFELTGRVPADAQPGTAFTNTATVTSDNDPAEENNSGTTTVVISTADVSVVKTGPATAVAGTTITYSVTVRNNGPDLALNVTITDPPLCAQADCTLGDLEPAESVTLTFSTEIPSGATSASNTATVSTDSIDPDPTNNSSTVNTVVTRTADVSVVKSGPATATAGTNVSYTITVANAGPSDATDVILTDTLPAGTTLVSFTCGANPCTIGTLAADASVVYTLVVRVDPNATGPLVNSATVTTSATDPAPGNNTSTATTQVARSADVMIVKSGPPTASAGTTITYTLTVTNNGPSDAADVVVTDTLPPGTTLQSSSCGANPCVVGTLAAGASTVVTLQVRVDVNVTGPLVNSATVTASTPDPVPANNTSTITTSATRNADVAVVKSGPPTATAGTTITYTLTVTNNGPSDAADVVVTDTLPPGTTLQSSSCGANPCVIGALAAGASTVVTLQVRVDLDARGPLVNSATVTASTPDPVPANNTSTITTNATPAPADLSIVKTVDYPETVVRERATFTLVVRNAGPGRAEDVVVTDELPAGTTLMSATPGCTGTTTVTCAAGNLAAGGSATFTIVVMLPSTPGTIANTARVTGSTPDPVPGNDASTVPIVVALPAQAIPTLSPAALAFLALTFAAMVLFVLRRAA